MNRAIHHPKLAARYYDAIYFARFCMDHEVSPYDAAVLAVLGQLAAAARERFEEQAKALGFTVEWPGL